MPEQGAAPSRLQQVAEVSLVVEVEQHARPIGQSQPGDESVGGGMCLELAAFHDRDPQRETPIHLAVTPERDQARVRVGERQGVMPGAHPQTAGVLAESLATRVRRLLAEEQGARPLGLGDVARAAKANALRAEEADADHDLARLASGDGPPLDVDHGDRVGAAIDGRDGALRVENQEGAVAVHQIATAAGLDREDAMGRPGLLGEAQPLGAEHGVRMGSSRAQHATRTEDPSALSVVAHIHRGQHTWTSRETDTSCGRTPRTSQGSLKTREDSRPAAR